MRYGFILSGLLVLLTGAYLDNVRGPILPVVTEFLGLDYGQSSWFLILGSTSATLTSLLTLLLIRRYDERTIASWFLVAGFLLGPMAFWISGLTSLLVFGIFVASIISGLGGLANLLVLKGTDSANRARYLCALHLMYGLGSLFGPLVARRLFLLGIGWQWVFVAALPLVLASLIANRSLPRTRPQVLETHSPQHLTRIDVAMLAVFAIYVGGEVITSMWMVAYLKDAAQMPVSEASSYLTYFFLSMAVTRGLGFVKLSSRGEFWVMSGSLTLAVFFSVLGLGGHYWALPCIGVFGPFFPIFLARISRAFPERAHALTIWVMASINGALILSHLLLGRLAALVGVTEAFKFSTLLLVATLGALVVYLNFEKKSRRPLLRGEEAVCDALV